MSSFETLGAVINIVQVIGVLLPLVHDPVKVRDLLEEAEARAKRIYQNIRGEKLLFNLQNVLPIFIDGTMKEFEEIRNELLLVKERVINCSTARSSLDSPRTLELLKQISSSLGQKEQNIMLIAMIAKLYVGLQSCTKDMREEFAKVLLGLNAQSEDHRLAELMLYLVCRRHL